MDLSRENLDSLFTGFQALLNRGLEQADTSYLKWCDEVRSSTAAEIYPLLTLSGSMREWIGDRVINSASPEKMTLANVDYERTESVPANAVADDRYNVYGRIFTLMGVDAGNLWAELATKALCEPGNWADGSPFYGPHEFGVTTIDNNLGTLELTVKNYETARKRMMSFCGADGKPLRLVPDTIIVGPDLEGLAKMIFEADLVNDGTNAAVSNIHRGECEICVNYGMTGTYAKYWFIVCTKRGIKPIVVQKRKDGPLVRKDKDTDDVVFWQNDLVFGYHSRGAALASMPHLIIGSFPANE